MSPEDQSRSEKSAVLYCKWRLLNSFLTYINKNNQLNDIEFKQTLQKLLLNWAFITYHTMFG